MTHTSSNRQAWTVVAILTTAYVLSFIDRMILNLMVDPIRADLEISDTQMSLLMGFSFALFYALCGIPLGRLADTGNRRRLITIGLLFWSSMTAACGLAKHYWQLFIFRMGVGVGEAALSPAAYSMISDHFPPERRATAISVYSMGIYLGMGLAFILGGSIVTWASAQSIITLPVIGDIRPWQTVFLVLGIAGLLFSISFVWVKEPARQSDSVEVVSVREVLAYMWTHRRAMLCHNLSFSMIAIIGYGLTSWIPSFFIRSHGWTVLDIGLAYGVIVMIFGSAGIVFGGRLADRFYRNGMSDSALKVSLGAILLSSIVAVILLLLTSAQAAIVLLAIWSFVFSMSSGLGPAAIQDMVPGRMRGQASALYLLIVNLIGLGFGPTAVALLTDYVFKDDLALRYSLVSVICMACMLAAGLIMAGLPAYRRAVQHLRAAA